MNKRKKSGKSNKPKRAMKPRGKIASRRKMEDPRPKTDEKYKNLPMKTIEERKAAQLAKWRKELGLDDQA